MQTRPSTGVAPTPPSDSARAQPPSALSALDTLRQEQAALRARMDRLTTPPATASDPRWTVAPLAERRAEFERWARRRDGRRAGVDGGLGDLRARDDGPRSTLDELAEPALRALAPVRERSGATPLDPAAWARQHDRWRELQRHAVERIDDGLRGVEDLRRARDDVESARTSLGTLRDLDAMAQGDVPSLDRDAVRRMVPDELAKDLPDLPDLDERRVRPKQAGDPPPLPRFDRIAEVADRARRPLQRAGDALDTTWHALRDARGPAGASSGYAERARRLLSVEVGSLADLAERAERLRERRAEQRAEQQRDAWPRMPSPALVQTAAMAARDARRAEQAARRLRQIREQADGR